MIANTIHINELIGGRIDPLQFHPERMNVIRAIKRGTWKKLKDVTINVKTITTKLSEGDIYVGLENIIGDTGEYISSNEKLTVSSAARFKKGDILFPKLRPYLNKVHIAQFDGCCSTEFHVFEAKDIHQDFLTIMLRSNMILAQTKHLMTGNTLPRLQTTDVENLLIPYPPMDTQRRIVEIYTNAQKARFNKRQEARIVLNGIDDYLLNKLDISLESKELNTNNYHIKLIDLIGGRLDVRYYNQTKSGGIVEVLNSSLYQTAPLSSLTKDIFQGVGKNETNDDTYVLLKVKNILQGNRIDYSDVEYVQSVPKNKILLGNDIISPFIGEAVRQNKFSIFDKICGNYTVDNNTGVIRLKDTVNAQYVCEYLCSCLGKMQIERLIGGGGVPFLGSNGAKKLIIIVPPIEIQNEIAKTIANIRNEADALINEGDALLEDAKHVVEKMIIG